MKALPVLLLLAVTVGCGSGTPEMPTDQLSSDELIATISHGEAVDLEDHLTDDTWTLFEYGADW